MQKTFRLKFDFLIHTKSHHESIFTFEIVCLLINKIPQCRVLQLFHLKYSILVIAELLNF